MSKMGFSSIFVGKTMEFFLLRSGFFYGCDWGSVGYGFLKGRLVAHFDLFSSFGVVLLLNSNWVY